MSRARPEAGGSEGEGGAPSLVGWIRSSPGRHRSFLRLVGPTGIAATASALSGLVLDVVIAAALGAGPISDAFFVATRLPLGLSVVMLSVGTQALVPTFARWRATHDTSEVESPAPMILVAGLVFGALLAGLGQVAAPFIVRLTAPGLSSGVEQVAISNTRVLFLIVPFVVGAEVLRAELNARRLAVGPAAMNAVMNLSIVLLVLVVSGTKTQAIAWAYVAGTLAQFLFILALAWKRGFRLGPVVGWRASPELSAASSLAVRPALASGLQVSDHIGQQVIVSFLPAGSITVLNLAYRLISALGGRIIFRSVVVNVLPLLTEAAARGQDRRFADLTRATTTVLLTVSVPLMVFVVILADPAVAMFFQWGEFESADASLLAATIGVYALSLPASAMQRSFLTPFWAHLDTKEPFRNTILGVLVHFTLLLPLVFLVGSGGRELVLAVAGAFSLAQYAIAFAAWRALRSRVTLDWTGMGRPLLILAGGLFVLATTMFVAVLALDLRGRSPDLMLLAGTSVVTCGGLLAFGALFAAPAAAGIRRDWQLPSDAPNKMG